MNLRMIAGVLLCSLITAHGRCAQVDVIIINPLTGPDSSYGQATTLGFRLSLQRGMQGLEGDGVWTDKHPEINLIVLDNEASTSQTATLARWLAERQRTTPTVIVGAGNSNSTRALAEVLAPTRVPMITANATVAGLISSEFPTLYRNTLSDDVRMDLVLDAIFDHTPGRVIAIVQETSSDGEEPDAYGLGLRAILREKLHREGWLSDEQLGSEGPVFTERLMELPFSKQMMDSDAFAKVFDPIGRKSASLNTPDTFVLHLGNDHFLPFTAAYVKRNLSLAVTYAVEVGNIFAREIDFPYVHGVLTFDDYRPNAGETAKRFSAEFRQRYLSEPTFGSAAGYDTGLLIVEVFRKLSGSELFGRELASADFKELFEEEFRRHLDDITYNGPPLSIQFRGSELV